MDPQKSNMTVLAQIVDPRGLLVFLDITRRVSFALHDGIRHAGNTVGQLSN